MILLHRITSFVLALLVAVGFFVLISYPQQSGLAVLIMLALVPLLFGRLLTWEFKRPSFWIFLGTPTFFLLASVFVFLFLENDLTKIFLAVITIIGIWLYAENIFSFYHLPSAYQAYALEYLSLAIYVVSVFFFASGAYATQLFLQLPVWVPALAMFWATLSITIGVFWVSKVAQETSIAFAVSGAIIMTELYVVLALLPTSYMTNAAALAVFLYIFLGLSRAHVLDKLSATVLKRYLAIGSFFLIIIFVTARWV